MPRQAPTLETIVLTKKLGGGGQGLVYLARLVDQEEGREPFVVKIQPAQDRFIEAEKQDYVEVAELSRRYPDLFDGSFLVTEKPLLWDSKGAPYVVLGASRRKVVLPKRERWIQEGKYSRALVLVSSRRDGVLSTEYRHFSKLQWYSYVTQICHVFQVLLDNGYCHGDAWHSNVAFMRVPEDRVFVLRGPSYTLRVPSGGYRWSLIDFGALHRVRELKDGTRVCGSLHKKRLEVEDLTETVNLVSGHNEIMRSCGWLSSVTPGHMSEIRREEDAWSKEILKSIYGPSLRLLMRRTGFDVEESLAILSLDALTKQLCVSPGKRRVEPHMPLDEILRLADRHGKYTELVKYFGKRTREEANVQNKLRTKLQA